MECVHRRCSSGLCSRHCGQSRARGTGLRLGASGMEEGGKEIHAAEVEAGMMAKKNREAVEQPE